MNMPMHLEIWRKAGASPVGMNYGEIYTSLQTGIIDAVEINLSSFRVGALLGGGEVLYFHRAVHSGPAC